MPVTVFIDAQPYVFLEEACRILDRKPSTVFGYVRSGILHPVRIEGDRRSLYLKSEVEAYAARLAAVPYRRLIPLVADTAVVEA